MSSDRFPSITYVLLVLLQTRYFTLYLHCLSVLSSSIDCSPLVRVLTVDPYQFFRPSHSESNDQAETKLLHSDENGVFG